MRMRLTGLHPSDSTGSPTTQDPPLASNRPSQLVSEESKTRQRTTRSRTMLGFIL